MFVHDYHSFGLYAKAAVNSAQQNVVTFQLVDGSGFGPLNVVDPSASFSLAGSGFAASSATTADIGVATLTINGTTVAMSNYGSGSTAASIAQDLSSQAASNSANNVPVAVTSEGPNLYLQVKQPTGSYSDSYSLTFSTNVSFSTSTPASGTLTGNTDVAPITVYSHCVGPVNPCPSSGGTSGYQANGNVQTLADSVMGNWTYGYDNLNRLTSGAASGGAYNGGFTCWTYDSFGNRLSQSVSATPCASNPPATFAASYSANNRISSVTAPPSTVIAYDAAGNVTSDGVNTYTYDAEGRVCALNGPQGMIGYQYDANGNRVGKGTVTNWQSCDITANGYTPTTDFVLDQSGGQMTELAIYTTSAGTQYQHVHSNVSAGGSLIASFDSLYNPHFYLTDALGSRRVQTDPAGIPEQTCQSLPFGDQLYCTGGSLTTPTEHHFTGKERDTESGLDYFGARYYSSNMGRWMSPDWAAKAMPVPYAKLDNPQSLNLYSYTVNNPLSNVDPDGHACSGILFNTNSGFCTRADAYAMFDNLVHEKTRFFAAASAATQELADVAVPVFGRAGTSQSTRDFLENTGETLLKVNQKTVLQVYNGEISGSGAELDSKLVHIEQSTVQQGLNDLQSKDPEAYSTAVSEINGLLNGKSSLAANVGAAIGGVILSTDGAYADVLSGVRTSLGRDINFVNQSDREAIGNALVQHVRQSGGCDVAGSRANGCSN
jgi:RHS repeat-associated protein